MRGRREASEREIPDTIVGLASATRMRADRRPNRRLLRTPVLLWPAPAVVIIIIRPVPVLLWPVSLLLCRPVALLLPRTLLLWSSPLLLLRAALILGTLLRPLFIRISMLPVALLRSALILLAASFFIPALARGFFQTAQADLPNNIRIFRFYFFWLLSHHFRGFQFFRPDAFAILRFYFLYCFNGHGVMLGAVGHAVPHEVLKNIFLHQEGTAPRGFEHISIRREKLQRIHISIQLIIEAALEAPALAA